MKLGELQRRFSDAATSTGGPPADLDEVFKGNATLSASARLAIYNRAYYYRLLDSLAAVFERTAQAFGKAEFERIGVLYIEGHPSEHAAVERVGRLFSQYLAGIESVSLEVVDLAALEWARLCALLAPNPTATAQAAAIDPLTFPSSCLCFVPSFSCLAIDARALRLFAGDRATLPALAPPAGLSDPKCGVAIFRRQYEVVHEALAPLEFEALRLASDGASLSQVCARFASGDDSADAERAFGVISGWFARGWLARSEPPSST